MTAFPTSPTLDHTGLTCRNLADSLAFYHGLLGLPVLDQGEGAGRAAGIEGARLRYATLDVGRGQVIELLEYRQPRNDSEALPVNCPGAAHVALAVADLDHVLTRLSEAGIRPLTKEPVIASNSGPHRWHGSRLVYVLDPDRHVIELVQLAGGAR